jgi:hypothetical protein
MKLLARPPVRWGLLALAAAVTLWLSFGGGQDRDVVQPVARAGASRAGTPAASPGRVAAGEISKPGAAPSAPTAAPSVASAGADRASETPELPARERLAQGSRRDPFAPRGWLPPPPKRVAPKVEPPPPPPPPPPPTAPPVPFKFIGQLEDRNAKPAVFLTKGDSLLVVHVGDVLESTYRVESFTSKEVVVTYLPLKERQVITASGG